MPINARWHNDEETILLEHFEGQWTTEDYFGLVDEAAALLSQKDFDVHIIADFSKSKTLPPNALAGLRYAEKKLPKNQGLVVFVQPGTLVNIFINIARQSGLRAAANLHTCDTIQEAELLIQRLSEETTQEPMTK